MTSPTVKLSGIAARLYIDHPGGDLFHYTSLTALSGIIPAGTPHGELYATDARYLNDALELRTFVHSIKRAMQFDLEHDDFGQEFQRRFSDWLDYRVADAGDSIFVTCFTKNGNLLSQWRSYGEQRKSISIGFNPDALQSAAHAQDFTLGRCLYEPNDHARVASEVLEVVKHEVQGSHPDDMTKVFQSVEATLLKIAVLFKDKGFYEEQEWRLVSRPIAEEDTTAIVEYRVGRSMLVPYIRFKLPRTHGGQVAIEQAFLGPTPHVAAAGSSVRRFLVSRGALPRRGLCHCQIPYRTT